MLPDAFEMRADDVLKHSRFGIASCAVAALVSAYLLVIGLLLGFGMMNAESRGDTAGAGIISVFLLFHLYVCGIGFAVGLLSGIVGAFRKGKNRLSSVVGLVLNAVPIIVIIGCHIYLFGWHL